MPKIHLPALKASPSGFSIGREAHVHYIRHRASLAKRVSICTYGITEHTLVLAVLEALPPGSRILVGLPTPRGSEARKVAKHLMKCYRRATFRVLPWMHAKLYLFEYACSEMDAVIGSHNLTGGTSAELSTVVRGKDLQTLLTYFEHLWKQGRRP
jgi:hypothetical protein